MKKYIKLNTLFFTLFILLPVYGGMFSNIIFTQRALTSSLMDGGSCSDLVSHINNYPEQSYNHYWKWSIKKERKLLSSFSEKVGSKSFCTDIAGMDNKTYFNYVSLYDGADLLSIRQFMHKDLSLMQFEKLQARIDKIDIEKEITNVANNAGEKWEEQILELILYHIERDIIKRAYKAYLLGASCALTAYQMFLEESTSFFEDLQDYKQCQERGLYLKKQKQIEKELVKFCTASKKDIRDQVKNIVKSRSKLALVEFNILVSRFKKQLCAGNTPFLCKIYKEGLKFK